MRIYVEYDYDGLYSRFWSALGGDVVKQRSLFLKEPSSFDLVCFTGGEDVSPELYGHKNLSSAESKSRDAREMLTFKLAQEHQIPMTGICRGAQFLNVMLGGTMVQHLRESHGGGRHLCRTHDGKQFGVTSSHHQMIVPGPEGLILAWAEQDLSLEDLVYDGNLAGIDGLGWAEKDRKSLHVTEAIHYPKQRIFAVQFHPEWMDIEEEASQWTLQQIRLYCFRSGDRTSEAS